MLLLPSNRSSVSKEILFMVDTSGSIDNSQIAEAYSEISGALEQFPSLTGYLGFFDSAVYKPLPFESVEDGSFGSMLELRSPGEIWNVLLVNPSCSVKTFVLNFTQVGESSETQSRPSKTGVCWKCLFWNPKVSL